MIYAFDTFELDTDRLELRRNGNAVALEPQVYALLCFLVENRGRVVTRDDIIGAVWNGRIVSESALSSRIKSLRRALGDDGQQQRLIRTLHRTGFRFVAETSVAEPPASVRAIEIADKDLEPVESERPSIAVLPFRLIGIGDPAIADALPQDLITELSRLRWLFVIARASSFRFRSEDFEMARIRAELGVRYCLSGTVEIAYGGMIVSVELSNTADGGVVWSDRFQAPLGAVHEIRQEIVRAIIGALELQIPLNEARRARLQPPDRLDAWSAYHLGLQHMYRFTRDDNALATRLFERAAELDPEFARAYAGLSFTYFQDAFLRYSGNSGSGRLARDNAEKSLERDPMDPFGNLTMGRSFLLRGDLEGALPWLDRANALNPNYAQAKYARAWVATLLDRATLSQPDVDAAMALSPLDPMRYAMLGVRAFSHILLGENAQAADWAERSANSPGAHVLIDLIAVVAHGLNGDDSQASCWADAARKRSPNLKGTDFLRAFPFRSIETRQRVAETLTRYGF